MDKEQDLFKIEGRFLLSVIRKWWRHMLAVTAIASLGAVIFSSPSFMPPVFKSRAIVYASNLTPYATENSTETMIQMFESEDIRARAIEDFDLIRHYGVDTNGRFPMTELFGIYNENVKITKTQYESAEVTVFDQDPMVASALCDSLMAYVDDKVISLHREKYLEVVNMHKQRLERERVRMDSMEAALRVLRTEHGILDFEEQVKPFSKSYYRAVEAGKAGNGNSRLDRIESTLAEKGGEFVSLKEHLWRVRGHYNDIRQEYEQAENNYEKQLTYVNIVTRPFPAEKKTYPLRMLVVLGAAASTAFFSLLLALAVEKFKRRA